MKFNLMFLFVALFVGATFATPPKKSKPVAYKADLKTTVIKWEGKKVTGKHNGTVNIKSGAIEVLDGMATSGNFIIDMTSIMCTDLTAGKGKEKLEGHLKSEDFFGTDAHPTAEFKATKITKVNGANYTVAGDLTIKGQTHPISFPANIVITKKMVKATGKVTIDRTLYGIKYGSGSFFDNLGDKAINNEFSMDIQFVANK